MKLQIYKQTNNGMICTKSQMTHSVYLLNVLTYFILLTFNLQYMIVRFMFTCSVCIIQVTHPASVKKLLSNGYRLHLGYFLLE